MKKKLVSIIIPVYNVEKYIKQCIESCLNQTYKDIEIIAIDDGSTDSSGIILDEISKKSPKLKVIHKQNNGVSSARNIGIRISKGDYIIFVDSDDYLSEDAVEYMISVITKTNSEFVILKNCFSNINQKQNEDKIYNITREEAIVLLLGLKLELGCWNKMYSRKMIMDNNLFFNEELFYGEGLEYIIKVAQTAKKIGIGNKRVYYYGKNNLLSATSKFNYKKFENGEKALINIKNNMNPKTSLIIDTWMFHYAMFAQNAMMSCINNKNSINNYKIIYKEWKRKYNQYYFKLITSKYISNHEKIKLIIIKISPTLFSVIRKHKNKKMIEGSV